MRPLTVQELLDIWEHGQALAPARRAVLLLSPACPEIAREDMVRLSVGRRDRLLMDLRALIFGSPLAALADCPACGERLDLAFDTADICVEPPALVEESLILDIDGYSIKLRLLNAEDLDSVSSGADIDTAERQLLERCISEARYQEAPVSANELPEAVVTSIGMRLAEADPQANTRLLLSCPTCHHQWLATFDILSFFWREIEVWAQRTFYEVHRLALAYGWREPDVLALSPWRRQNYLAMIGA
jgi:hypothetical protein